MVHLPDSIENYLATPTVDGDEVKATGGVMMYWYRKEESCPNLSRFGSDYCSAPGMSSAASLGVLSEIQA
jgi:hypothetical protein